MYDSKQWPKGLIVVSVGAPSINECMDSLQKAVLAEADAIEFRFDQMQLICQEEILKLLPSLDGRYDGKVRFILTYRTAGHGGPGYISLNMSVAFWVGAFFHHAQAIHAAFLLDWEWELVQRLSKTKNLGGTPIPWPKILVSRHVVQRTPDESELRQMLGEMSATKAGAMKFAFKSGGSEDNDRILRLYGLNQSGKPMLAVGMGVPGIETRLSWLRHEALMTFGRIDEKGSASGQPPIAELTELRKKWFAEPIE